MTKIQIAPIQNVTVFEQLGLFHLNFSIFSVLSISFVDFGLEKNDDDDFFIIVNSMSLFLLLRGLV